MKVLMVGVDETTKGGMWTVVENYLNDKKFCEETQLKYIPTSITGSKTKRVLFTAKSFLKLGMALVTGKYDIVHVHMSERGSVYRKNLVMSMATFFKCKIVLHMHGAEFETWYKSTGEKTKAFVRSTLDKADSILILGEYWSDFIQSLVKDKGKVQVLYNAVTVPDHNKYEAKAKNLLFLGVVGKRKGVYDLLRAMKKIDAQLDQEVKLLIYGPDFENKIEQEIKNHALNHRVEYRGWLSKDQKKEVFPTIAVNVLPSYNEGLPMTILETMALGIPNISTNVAAIPEAVSQENGSLIVPGDVDALAESICILINDENTRLEKSKNAYAVAEKRFSVQGHLEKLLHIYNDLR